MHRQTLICVQRLCRIETIQVPLCKQITPVNTNFDGIMHLATFFYLINEQRVMSCFRTIVVKVLSAFKTIATVLT